ncbi:MAG: tRNA pseudouridine(55) synthase TruB [Clostridia bacterium]|nr:tRNA pseudouridine(55) synthase TruB [Clostridia bacterium]
MEINGIVLLDKPQGRTSHDMVNAIRRLAGTRRVGHTGTLDPIATGVLPIVIGNATKAAEILTCETKEYEAELIFGAATDTGDCEGEIIKSGRIDISETEIEAAADSLKGNMQQIPPMYSAKKHNGRKLYELAREGKTVEREPVRITVYDVSVISVNPAEHSARIRVSCSKGTYIRALCEELGERIGTCAYMSALRRTASGSFKISECRTLSELAQMAEEGRFQDSVIPVDKLFGYEKITLSDKQSQRIKNGVFVSHPGISDGERYSVYASGGEFIALADCIDGRLHIYKSFWT